MEWALRFTQSRNVSFALHLDKLGTRLAMTERRIAHDGIGSSMNLERNVAFGWNKSKLPNR